MSSHCKAQALIPGEVCFFFQVLFHLHSTSTRIMFTFIQSIFTCSSKYESFHMFQFMSFPPLGTVVYLEFTMACSPVGVISFNNRYSIDCIQSSQSQGSIPGQA